eukprot:4805903-Lingulodinium_polyedra.AAC.1
MVDCVAPSTGQPWARTAAWLAAPEAAPLGSAPVQLPSGWAGGSRQLEVAVMLDALPCLLGPPIHRGRAVITRGRWPADPPDAARCGTSGVAEGPRTLCAKFAVANVLTLGRES